jgi:hypothetical protein
VDGPSLLVAAENFFCAEIHDQAQQQQQQQQQKQGRRESFRY